MGKNKGEMSGGVRSVGFDRATHTLRVGFADGAVYEFAEVPEHVFDELRYSESPNEYFEANIREDFASVRVGDIDLAEIAHELREERLLDPGWEDADGADAADARRERNRGRRSEHRWIVGVIDEDSAAVEVDGRQITPMPRWILPADASDGDVLRVTHLRSATRSTISIELDPAATREAFQRSAGQVEGTETGDSGGDVDLRR